MKTPNLDGWNQPIIGECWFYIEPKGVIVCAQVRSIYRQSVALALSFPDGRSGGMRIPFERWSSTVKTWTRILHPSTFEPQS